MRTLKTLLDGLSFPEGPRWRDGRLLFSDMHRQRVIAVDPAGRSETVLELNSSCPSGLGWLPDGRLLVVSMEDRRLLRADPEGPVVVADCTPFAGFHCNDMVVDAEGRAYIGNFGFDLHGGGTPCPANLVLVRPAEDACVAASNLWFPNGAVITSDGKTLVVAETFAARLTAFDILPDGSLSHRRVWASLGKADNPLGETPQPPVPDGIALDAEGGIWVASPTTREVLRVLEGGAITERIPVSTSAFACMLGGADGRTLFVCTSLHSHPVHCRETRTGRIEYCEVDIPHAGLP